MQIGRYQVLKELGRGAMGLVYAATDPAIGRTVAIKTIHLSGAAAGQALDDLRQRLRREAQSAGSLSHPGIVTIHDIGEEGEDAFIVMEYVDGKTLEEVFSSSVPQHTAFWLDILKKTGDALDYAHRRGIVHRDVKPSNLMLCADGAVKVTDFGIAKVSTSTSMTQTGLVLGTPNYMSPEQARGSPVDGRSDQFSLAVVAYRMLSGSLPFAGPTLTAVLTQILLEEPRYSNTALNPEEQQVLRRALAKDPAQRFATCSAFALALEQAFLGAKPSSAEALKPEVPPDDAAARSAIAFPAVASAGTPAQPLSRDSLLATVGTLPQPVQDAGPGIGAQIPIGLDLGNPVEEPFPVTAEAEPEPAGQRSRWKAKTLMPAAALALLAASVALWIFFRPAPVIPVQPAAQPVPPPATQPAAPAPSQLEAVAPTKATPGPTARPPQSAPRRVATKTVPARKSEPVAPPSQEKALPVAAPVVSAPPPLVRAPAAGAISWKGRMAKNSLLVIDGSNPSFGSLTGSLPGTPVTIEVEPPEILVREQPGENNGWKRIMLYSPSRTVTLITIRWQEVR